MCGQYLGMTEILIVFSPSPVVIKANYKQQTNKGEIAQHYEEKRKSHTNMHYALCMVLLYSLIRGN